ncbi:hypothetical protein GCM10012275_52990 [Longimycelium tulufanense]|uniref:Uncharacterized protein n=1 Tax=Longimycelium tulufanense TaxID=907463 RepID=A0A8J3CCY3_9PSEU|nr:hypothetical protein GCM10012275_52990 [Longimycelium tulufanense]
MTSTPNMQPVPAELALLALRRSGWNIRPATLRSWAHRGYIRRTATGYDLRSILEYVTRRTERWRLRLTPGQDACNAVGGRSSVRIQPRDTLSAGA